MTNPILAIQEVRAGYGHALVLRAVNLHVERGEMVTLIGANGAGKTTLLLTISGILKPRAGSIEYQGEPIGGLPADRIVGKGLCQAPQNAQLFPKLTVYENLQLGAWLTSFHDKPRLRRKLEEIYSYFKVLRARSGQQAGTLSGGERQMLAIARALMAEPQLLMLDEPSAGVAPVIIDQLADIITGLQRSGLSILLVEQNAHLALDIADRAYVLESGQITYEGKAGELRGSEAVRRSYLGA
jgi:branched-chain amino acid transport system ATP-binding protein